jgi:formylglycine-generating enzyme required for sulfatase activity
MAIDLPHIATSTIFTLSTESYPGMVYAADRYLGAGLTGLPIEAGTVVNAFHIDKYPVTNAEFQKFVDDGSSVG